MPGVDVSEASAEHARAAVAAGLVPVHAGAIERHDRVVALAGPSSAGKSTLTAMAVRAGWGYVADEVCAIDPRSLAVHPFHRPIGLRRIGADVVGIEFTGSGPTMEWSVEPSSRSAGGALAAIVLVDRGDPPPSLTMIPTAAALADLTRHLVVPVNGIEATFERLERIVRSVPAWRARYDDADAGIELLERFADP